MIKLLFFLFFINIFFIESSFSQNTKKANKFYIEGNRFYSVGDFDSAINLFLKSLKADSNFCPSIYKLGLSYKKKNLFDDFIRWFLFYEDKICSENKDDVNYKLGESFFLLGEINKAKGYLMSVKDSIRFIDYPKYLSYINYNIDNSSVSFFEFEQKGLINNSFFQYSPQFQKSKNKLYYTVRKGKRLFDDEDISSYSMVQNKILFNNVFSYLNTDNNEGTPSISEDGSLMVYTSCEMNFKKNSCDIFYVEKKENSWSSPVKFSNTINSKYWDSQPFLYKDKLFFVSNRPGGKGARDIYFSQKNDKYGWSKAENLSYVNTLHEEVSPFVENDIIYFSSNRSNSYGGYDIFLLDNISSKNKSVINLGSSINSHQDETSIFLTDKNIFLTVEDKLNQNIRSSIVIGDILKKYKSEKKFKVLRTFDSISNQELKGVISIKSDLLETTFKTNQKIDEEFLENSIIVAGADGYFPLVTEINDRDTINIFLNKLTSKIILENIYFDFDSYHLDDDSKKYLNVIADWLKESNIKSLEISGHTDNIGNENYNLKLSEERALSVYNYINTFGISNIKINYKGYGSSLPISKTYVGPKNRRIEFTIINE